MAPDCDKADSFWLQKWERQGRTISLRRGVEELETENFEHKCIFGLDFKLPFLNVHFRFPVKCVLLAKVKCDGEAV